MRPSFANANCKMFINGTFRPQCRKNTIWEMMWGNDVTNERKQRVGCRTQIDQLSNINIWYDKDSGNVLYQFDWEQTALQLEGFSLALSTFTSGLHVSFSCWTDRSSSKSKSQTSQSDSFVNPETRLQLKVIYFNTCPLSKTPSVSNWE